MYWVGNINFKERGRRSFGGIFKAILKFSAQQTQNFDTFSNSFLNMKGKIDKDDQ